MHKRFLITGALLGAIAVALGAFAAHGLKQIMPVDSVQTFQTGVQYQMVHAIALLITGILYDRFRNKLISLAGTFFIIGIILFSGSLYLLTILKAAEITGFNKVGIITPFGGISFITGWLLLATGIIRKNI